MNNGKIFLADAVDIHSHILPGIDDGSTDGKTSVSMLKMLYEQGVRRVAATPHFYPHETNFEAFFEKRRKSVETLKEAIAEENINELPGVYLGAEVAYFDGMSKYSTIKELCIAGTDYLLLEMPFCKWSEKELEDVAAIKAVQGVTPIIAHIERYLPFQKKEIIRKMLEGDALIQCNAEAFLSIKTRRQTLKLLSDGNVDVIGSDCHNLTRRAPKIKAAFEIIERKLGADAVIRLSSKGSLLLENAQSLW